MTIQGQVFFVYNKFIIVVRKELGLIEQLTFNRKEAFHDSKLYIFAAFFFF